MPGYKYATGDLLEERNTYFYTTFEGKVFLDSWSESRNEILKKLPEPQICEPSGEIESLCMLKLRIETDEVVQSESLLNTLYHELFNMDSSNRKKNKELEAMVDLMVQRFEVSKRIHKEYWKKFRAVDKRNYKNLSLYVQAAEVYEIAYDVFKKLTFLNVLIKILDTICAVHSGLEDSLNGRVSALLQKEKRHVNNLANSVGVLL
jgi:methionyl-tRNA formyltransferase